MRNGWTAINGVLDAVIFDFDGVVVESAEIKSDAFRIIFSHFPGQVERIVELHEAHAGLSRYVKFEMIYRDILQQPLNPDQSKILGEKFSAEVFDRVCRCPMVAGAKGALEALSAAIPLAIVSGTPQDELTDIVSRRELGGFFSAVLGSPARKADLMRGLLRDNGWRASRVAVVGDAMEDQAAAQANGLGFVGRVPPGKPSPFAGDTIIVEDLRPLADALRAAVADSKPLSVGVSS